MYGQMHILNSKETVSSESLASSFERRISMRVENIIGLPTAGWYYQQSDRVGESAVNIFYFF